MQKVEDYRKHADECRSIARRSRSLEERDMLLNMARTWDDLASHRAAQITRHQRHERHSVRSRWGRASRARLARLCLLTDGRRASRGGPMRIRMGVADRMLRDQLFRIANPGRTDRLVHPTPEERLRKVIVDRGLPIDFPHETWPGTFGQRSALDCPCFVPRSFATDDLARLPTSMRSISTMNEATRCLAGRRNQSRSLALSSGPRLQSRQKSLNRFGASAV
jgi:hypothetical protein